jgi:PEP-CTERM motif
MRGIVGRLSLMVVVSLLCLAPAVLEANTLLSENFNELTPALAVTSAGAFDAIDGTNVDIVGGSLFGYLCVSPESGNCIDMDGSGGNPQGVLQSKSAFTLTPGVSYDLSFDLIGSQRGNTASTTVTFGPYSQTFVLPSSDDTSGIVTNQLITVSAPTTTYLTFTSNTPGDVGDLLDNVLLTSSSTTRVPEPSSLILLSLGLLGLGVVTRLRRAVPR